MGLIRKTVSIATLGIVDFRSQKELVRRAEKAQRAAQADLASIDKARALTDKRLVAAEQRARDAEALASRQAELARQGKTKRRDRRRSNRSDAIDSIGGLVASAGPAVEERARDLSRRGRKAAKKARKQAEDAAAKARKQAQKHGRRARRKIDEITERAGELVDEHR